MVVENMEFTTDSISRSDEQGRWASLSAVRSSKFTTDSISRSDKQGRWASLSAVRSSICRMVSGYFRGYQQTDGVQDGKATDFVNENVNKEQSVWCCHLE